MTDLADDANKVEINPQNLSLSGSRIIDGANQIEINPQNGAISTLAFLNDAVSGYTRIVCGSFHEDGNIHIWDTDVGFDPKALIKAGGSVYAIAVSKDGKKIVTGGCTKWGKGGFATVWDARTHVKEVEVQSHTMRVLAVDIAPDGMTFATGSEDCTASVWSTVTGERRLGPWICDSPVTAVRFSPNGDRIAVAQWDRPSICIHDCHDGQLRIDIRVEVSSAYSIGVVWSRDGTKLFVISYGSIRCLDVATGSILCGWPIHGNDEVASIVLAGSGKFLVASAGDSISFWDASTQEQIGPVIKLTGKVLTITLSPDSRRLASGREDEKITLQSLDGVLPSYYFIDPVVQLPLMQISDTALDFWIKKDWTNAEAVLTKEIMQSPGPSYHLLANRALIRAHLQQWPAAQHDAEESLMILPSAIGHVAKVVVLIGKGEAEAAMRLFDLVFGHCDSDDNKILLVIKSILLYLWGKHEDAMLRLQDMIAVYDMPLYPFIQAQMYVLKGKIYMKEGDYEHAIQTFKDAMVPTLVHGSLELQTISMIFGWSLDRLSFTTRRCLCEALFAARYLKEAAIAFKLFNTLHEPRVLCQETKEWMGDFRQQGVTASELDGDSAMDAGNYEEACMHYETAFMFSPEMPKTLLTKWIKTKLMDNSWAVTLNAVIQVPKFIIYQAIIESLQTAGHVTESNKWFQKMTGKLGEIVEENDQAKWVLDLEQKCSKKLESLGDAALSVQNPEEANMHYTTALVLNPFLPEELLLKWSKIKLMNGSWKEALDAATMFKVSKFEVYQAICEVLKGTGSLKMMVECLGKMSSDLQINKMTGHDSRLKWFENFTQQYTRELEHLGDASMVSKNHEEAIEHYSAALLLNPPMPQQLLIKRCKAQIAKGIWKDALYDANKVIELDSKSPWGYERKHAALHGMQNYDEALEAFNIMLLKIEGSHDPEISKFRENYVAPHETIAAIDVIILEILKICPLVLIDVTTGRLCDRGEQSLAFKSEAVFKELLSSMTTGINHAGLLQAVSKYFQYVMLSHVWEGKEPTYQDVNVVESVWKLDSSLLTNDKLRKFCELVREDGYRWAWSDTCCINKTTSTLLNQSLTSMYKWYEESAATLVLLASMESPSVPGALTKSVWMTRAWTLQELLSPKVVRFYDRAWKPYLNDTRANHKDSPVIMQELADAIRVAPQTIVAFRPSELGVREKLRLASTRNATVEEDVAYSLIGIFKSDIRPNYGEGEAALGHLLEETVARSGEVTVLAWTGKSSTYNSCLPATLAVYSQMLYASLPIADDEMETHIAEIRGVLAQQEAMIVYDRVARLPPARFANRRLHLPCIVFFVKRLDCQPLAGRVEHVTYRARISVLGDVEFKTKDWLPLMEPRRLLLVHPWIRDILDQTYPLSNWEDDMDMDSDSDVDVDGASAPQTSAVPSAPLDSHIRALRLLVRLRQPFSALLLERKGHQEFKRVATEHEIIVQVRKIPTSKDIHTGVLEIL